MVLKIRGFPLPPLLEKFLNEGIWTSKRTIDIPQPMLSAVGIQLEVVVRLYDLEDLRLDNENTYLSDLSDESFEFFEWCCAYASSKRSDKAITDTNKLDIDYGICIASDIGDDAIFLDYRIDEANPRVLIMDWNNRIWRILALDFDTFAKGVGLTD